MRRETVEIFSDLNNAAVLRRPERKFPGVLVQEDTLHSLRCAADSLVDPVSQSSADAQAELEFLRVTLRVLVAHYKAVMRDHGLPLPFSEPHDV